MIITTTILTAVTKKSILLLLMKAGLTPDNKFEKWLLEDGFDEKTLKTSGNFHLFEELNRLKIQFRKDLIFDKDYTEMGEVVIKPILDSDKKPLEPWQIYLAIETAKLRIQKVRLMINHKFHIIRNLNPNTNIAYKVIRTYWLDNNGKPIKKFSKVLGAENKILVNGKIPEKLIELAKKELENQMWITYLEEYKGV